MKAVMEPRNPRSQNLVILIREPKMLLILPKMLCNIRKVRFNHLNNKYAILAFLQTSLDRAKFYNFACFHNKLDL